MGFFGAGRGAECEVDVKFQAAHASKVCKVLNISLVKLFGERTKRHNNKIQVQLHT